MSMYSRLGALLILVSITLPLCSCEEDVTSADGDVGPFSMYGILNPRVDTQTIGIFSILSQIDLADDDLDATLTSTDLRSGETISWTDSVHTDSSGRMRHVFWADFTPSFGHDYMIALSRGDGAESVATTHVPSTIETRVKKVGAQTMEILIDGDRFHLLAATLTYRIGWGPDGACEHPRGSYKIDYVGDVVAAQTGYSFRVNMVVEHERLLAAYLQEHPGYQWTPTISGLGLFGITLDLTVAEPAWNPPNGEFDPDVLVQPGTMTNVTNGYGFIGAGFYETAPISAPEDIIGSTWFFDFQDPNSSC